MKCRPDPADSLPCLTPVIPCAAPTPGTRTPGRCRTIRTHLGEPLAWLATVRIRPIYLLTELMAFADFESPYIPYPFPRLLKHRDLSAELGRLRWVAAH